MRHRLILNLVFVAVVKERGDRNVRKSDEDIVNKPKRTTSTCECAGANECVFIQRESGGTSSATSLPLGRGFVLQKDTELKHKSRASTNTPPAPLSPTENVWKAE